MKRATFGNMRVNVKVSPTSQTVAQATAVPCAVCKASISQRCVDSSGSEIALGFHAARIRASTWSRLDPDNPVRRACDMCERSAIWAHPAGGFRCSRCPRPEK